MEREFRHTTYINKFSFRFAFIKHFDNFISMGVQVSFIFLQFFFCLLVLLSGGRWAAKK